MYMVAKAKSRIGFEFLKSVFWMNQGESQGISNDFEILFFMRKTSTEITEAEVFSKMQFNSNLKM